MNLPFDYHKKIKTSFCDKNINIKLGLSYHILWFFGRISGMCGDEKEKQPAIRLFKIE
jgi:hypothetical protein